VPQRSSLSEIVRRAAQRRYWREVYVGIPYGGRVLEGYIDLLDEEDEGLVIIDYKTDSWRAESELDEKAERYRVQLQAVNMPASSVRIQNYYGQKNPRFHEKIGCESI
jgi:ATP-dependent exoDNAse (exonuclease V) beta subunit